MTVKQESIGILGGGILGLSAAYASLLAGLGDVVVYEAQAEPGGLAATFKLGKTRLERFHHFICHIDRSIMEQMRDFGLESHLAWRECRMGIFAKERIYDFTTPADLLAFDALDVLSRLRLGASMFFLQHIKRWEPLERVPASRWLRRWAGRRSYETVWAHLMQSKFNGYEDEIPLSWLWARTRRRAGSKRPGSSLEHFGYVKGSVAVLIDEYLRRIAKLGGSVKLGCPVARLSLSRSGGFIVSHENGQDHHSLIVSTLPLPSLLSVSDFLPQPYRASLAAIRYQTVLNVVLVLELPLSKFFWLNIADRSIPFPGIIEYSNLRPTSEFGGKSIIYLPNYLPANHRLNSLSNEQLVQEYIEALGKVFPRFRREMVQRWYVFRYPYADPYYTLNYSKLLPKHRTPVEGLYIFNTSQIYPITRNVSNSILFGRKAAKMLQEDIAGQ